MVIIQFFNFDLHEEKLKFEIQIKDTCMKVSQFMVIYLNGTMILYNVAVQYMYLSLKNTLLKLNIIFF